MAFHWNQNHKETILFPYNVFQSKTFKNLLKLSEEKSRLLNWEHLFWHNSIARKYSKYFLFSPVWKKDQTKAVVWKNWHIPKKAEKSLLIVSGTLCNKSASGIKHELFVKSICVHTQCVTLLETTQNIPLETPWRGSQQQSPLCHSKGTPSDNCIPLASIRFTPALQNLQKSTLSIF